MASSPRIALMVGVVAACAGCTAPQFAFDLVDLSRGKPAPPSLIVVGSQVVARIENGGGPEGVWDLFAGVDVFPRGAVLSGAWIEISIDGITYGGPAGVFRVAAEDRYIVRWSATAEQRSSQPGLEGRPSTTLWIGPICFQGHCDTFRIDDGDWPTRDPIGG